MKAIVKYFRTTNILQSNVVNYNFQFYWINESHRLANIRISIKQKSTKMNAGNLSISPFLHFVYILILFELKILSEQLINK